MAHALETRFREPTGLAVTIAVHLCMAALVLIGFKTVTAPPPRAPLVTTAIPAPPQPIRDTPQPQMHDQPLTIDAFEPKFDIAPVIPPVSPRHDQQSEPQVVDNKGNLLSDPPPQLMPVGPSSLARLDQRYAGDFQPPYPPSEQRAGITGAVVVHVRIGPDGRVTAASIARSSGSARLDQAAVLQALKKWRFVAALKDGIAVEAERDITVTFRLLHDG